MKKKNGCFFNSYRKQLFFMSPQTATEFSISTYNGCFVISLKISHIFEMFLPCSSDNGCVIFHLKQRLIIIFQQKPTVFCLSLNNDYLIFISRQLPIFITPKKQLFLLMVSRQPLYSIFIDNVCFQYLP